MGRAIAIVAVLGVVALLIGGAVGYFALGNKKSSTTSAPTTTKAKSSKSTTRTTEKATTTTGPPSTTGKSIDPLTVPAGFNAYRAGNGVPFAIALPQTWTAVLLDSGALDHEADVHSDWPSLVALVKGVKTLKSQNGIFFAYDNSTEPNFADNVNVIKNTKVKSLPADAQDTIRNELTSGLGAENIQFVTEPIADTTATVASYEVTPSGGSKVYGIQAYFTGSDALYIVTMTFGTPEARLKDSAAVFPTINVP